MRKVETFKDALREMVDRPFLASIRYSEQQTRADRDLCHPDILVFEKALVKRLKDMGVPMFCHCARRGAVEQQKLFDEGYSKAMPGQSPHNFGLAVDVIHGTRAWELSRKSWEVIGHVGKEVAQARGIKLKWGGDWEFYDPAHWQLADWDNLVDPATWEPVAKEPKKRGDPTLGPPPRRFG